MCDGYFVKYFASVVALLVYGAPLYFRDPAKRGSQNDITQDYIRAMRLLQNTSRWGPCIPVSCQLPESPLPSSAMTHKRSTAAGDDV